MWLKVPLISRYKGFRVASKAEILKSNFFLVHSVPIRLKWGGNMFFNCNSVFERNLKLILCAYTFRQNLYLKKILKIRSSLTWRQSKKCKICARIAKTNILLQLLLSSSLARMFPKYICRQKQPSRCIFQYRWSATVVKFFEKYLWWSAILSKFPYNTLQLWTNAAEKLYFITALINPEQQLQQNTSRKLLLCLEVFVRRCSSK